MGAAHWDATVQSANGPVNFDFRKMDRAARSKWYGMFMGSVRKVFRNRKRSAA